MKKTLPALSIGALVFLSGARAAAPTGVQLERAVLLSMTLSHNYEESILGVRILAQRFPYDDSLCDYVAERLLKEPESPRGTAAEAVSWYVITLRDSCSARYRNVLTLAHQRYTNPAILKQLDIPPVKPADPAVKQYAEDEVDLLAREAELQRQLAALARGGSSARYVRAGATFATVLEVAGAPQGMSALIGSTLAMHYRGAGILIFHGDRATHVWTLGETFPELFPIGDSFQGTRFEVAQSIACLRRKPFRLYVKVHEDEIRKDPELMWVLANRLTHNGTPTDRYEEDGLLVALEVIVKSGHPDTIAMLKQIGAAPGGKVTEDARSFAGKLERQAEKVKKGS
jgi:hypothetical protein